MLLHLATMLMTLAAADASVGAWVAEDGALALVQGEQPIWRFVYGPDAPQPYFHPVALPGGPTLTWANPPDHRWHRGLWFCWKTINGVNYWEEDAETGKPVGKTEVTDIRVRKNADFSARLDLELAYSPPNAAPVLRETRRIEVTPPRADGSYIIDWTSAFTAGDEELLLEGGTSGGGYAGLSVRVAEGSSGWRAVNSEGASATGQEGRHPEMHGARARWLDFSMEADGSEAGIAIFDHPDNPRHPTEWYVLMDEPGGFGYYSPALLYSQPLTLQPGEELTLRYRILVHPGRGGAEELQQAWEGFTDAR